MSFLKKNMIICLLMLTVGCSNPGKRVEMATDPGDPEAAVKETLIAMWAAIEKGDIDRYASYIHADFTQFGETDSILRIGKEAEVKGIRSWVDRSSSIHTEMLDPKITVKGNVAWIVYYWSDQGSTDGEAFATKGKSTRIFVKENDIWLCIHGHYTLMP